MTPEAVKALEGQELGVTSWFTLDQPRIDAFADLTEDPQWIHIDPERAARTPFGGTIAHGFHTLSMLSAMFYEVIPTLDNETHGVNYGFDKLRFLAPVPAGARIRGRFVLTRADIEVPGQVTLHTAVTVEIDGAAKPAIAADWINRSYHEVAA